MTVSAIFSLVLGGAALFSGPGPGEPLPDYVPPQMSPERDSLAAPPTGPRWIRRPNPADFERAYPVAALRDGVNGSVVLACKVAEGGTLADCQVARESPAGHGFGSAAMTLIRRFATDPAHVPPGTPVLVPIQFMMAE